MPTRGEKLLFSSIRDLPEDERTTRYLQQVAHEAGLFTDFCYLDEAGFINTEGVFNKDKQLADFWFKLFPLGRYRRAGAGADPDPGKDRQTGPDSLHQPRLHPAVSEQGDDEDPLRPLPRLTLSAEDRL